jgi:hypothetical protein
MKTAMQELFSQLEIEHPNLFNTNTLEGRKFINDYYKFLVLEKQQIIDAYDVVWVETIHNGEEYYNVTFKTEIK